MTGIDMMIVVINLTEEKDMPRTVLTDQVSQQFRNKVRNSLKLQVHSASNYLSDDTIYAVIVEEVDKLRLGTSPKDPDDEDDEEEDPLTPQQRREQRIRRREEQSRNRIAEARGEFPE
jgi:hypothetical protein